MKKIIILLLSVITIFLIAFPCSALPSTGPGMPTTNMNPFTAGNDSIIDRQNFTFTGYQSSAIGTIFPGVQTANGKYSSDNIFGHFQIGIQIPSIVNMGWPERVNEMVDQVEWGDYIEYYTSGYWEGSDSQMYNDVIVKPVVYDSNDELFRINYRYTTDSYDYPGTTVSTASFVGQFTGNREIAGLQLGFDYPNFDVGVDTNYIVSGTVYLIDLDTDSIYSIDISENVSGSIEPTNNIILSPNFRNIIESSNYWVDEFPITGDYEYMFDGYITYKLTSENEFVSAAPFALVDYHYDTQLAFPLSAPTDPSSTYGNIPVLFMQRYSFLEGVASVEPSEPPFGTIEITSNGRYNVSSYRNAFVNVPQEIIEDVNAFSWLFGAVNGILVLEILPGFSIGNVLLFIAGLALLVWILKIFLGG